MDVVPDADSECPDCGASDAVSAGVCDLCLADLGERRPPGLRGAAVTPPGVIEEPRFADVIAELRAAI